MNPISAFFVRNIVVVFFFYGLAFFAMGLALALASRRSSEFRFAQAIRPLAAFGIIHGGHEWFEMFQKMAVLTGGYRPTLSQELIRLAILAASFLMLIVFGLQLLRPTQTGRRDLILLSAAMTALWLGSVAIAQIMLNTSLDETLTVADVLARYTLGIPGALLGTWALMTQQRTFREVGMPQFGRDLVWCATALLMYGVIGQLFVRSTSLVPSNVLNSTLFLQWFGIPVQLFRGTMAMVLALFMVRALNAFELENTHRLERANAAKLEARAAALEAERRITREMERLNEELQLTAQELSLLLNLSNLLDTPASLPDRFRGALEEIVSNLHFPDAALILLIRRRTEALEVRAATGCHEGQTVYDSAQQLGQECVTKGMALCRHTDGAVIEFPLEKALDQKECRRYPSPVTMISLPLTAQEKVIGSIVLCRTETRPEKGPSPDEFELIVGIAQQLGLSIDNARLYQEAQERERLLADLLHQVVGAQEAERQRIARELHDATGQSLTAIALGLRGTESLLKNSPSIAAEQIRELKSFTTSALGELRQLIADLRPSQLDDLGLIPALQWYTQEFEKRFGIQTDFVMRGERVRLPAEYETVLFRVAQEALTNIAKHAQADHAAVELEIQPSQICMNIRDDGRGFNPKEVFQKSDSRAGWGLLGIQERTALLGGHYEIESQSGHGTQIRVHVPLIEETEDGQDKTVVS